MLHLLPRLGLRRVTVATAWARMPPVASQQRSLRTSLPVLHGDFEMKDPATPEEVVRISIVTRDGERHEMPGKVGDNLLYLFHRWRRSNPDLALEGACEASLACSTCHVIVCARVTCHTTHHNPPRTTHGSSLAPCYLPPHAPPAGER
jgi:ferredoxin